METFVTLAVIGILVLAYVVLGDRRADKQVRRNREQWQQASYERRSDDPARFFLG
jgi:hypothetical protein